MGMFSLGQIRIAHRRRIPGGATTVANGNSDDGAPIADGAGKMGTIGIFRIEVVGILVSNSESSEPRKGETIGATDMGGGELYDGSASNDEWVSSSSTPSGGATIAAPPPVQLGPQQK
nr:hypothetical protein [Tanacetum cinerariifolium]